MYNLWGRVQAKAAEMLEFSKQCSALGWCNGQHGQGECKMNRIEGAGNEIMTCDCAPTYAGATCADKLPEKTCVKWRTNKCTAHNIHHHQTRCEDQFDGKWYMHTWVHCWGTLGGAFVCKKDYTCQRQKEAGEDCCGELEDGERWAE
mmetsp:Transcript_10494/g.29699  ORF Transcript_10494/g.29699 Transcript_10494/m.29699 type:complete len:147 (+) Transcript_10494:1-441(+)